MDTITTVIAFLALLISFISLYRTRKKNEADNIQSVIDTQIQEQIRQAAEKAVALKIDELDILKRRESIQKVPDVTARFIGKKLVFTNRGGGTATDVNFEVTNHGRGKPPFVDSPFPMSMDSGQQVSIRCALTADTFHPPFTILIAWQDNSEKHYDSEIRITR